MATGLRNRMLADIRSAGLAASTQEVYIHSVRGLAAYYWRSPDMLSEAGVRAIRGALLERSISCTYAMSGVWRAAPMPPAAEASAFCLPIRWIAIVARQAKVRQLLLLQVRSSSAVR